MALGERAGERAGWQGTSLRRGEQDTGSDGSEQLRRLSSVP